MTPAERQAVIDLALALLKRDEQLRECGRLERLSTDAKVSLSHRISEVQEAEALFEALFEGKGGEK